MNLHRGTWLEVLPFERERVDRDLDALWVCLDLDNPPSFNDPGSQGESLSEVARRGISMPKGDGSHYGANYRAGKYDHKNGKKE